SRMINILVPRTKRNTAFVSLQHSRLKRCKAGAHLVLIVSYTICLSMLVAAHSMPSSQFPLSQYLNDAISAARIGAAILQAHSLRRADLIIDKKARNDLVSQADHDAEDAIIEHLREATPQ